MNHEVWSRVDINVLLNALLLSLKVIFGEASIKHSHGMSKSKEHTEFNNWHYSTDGHSLDYGGTYISVPPRSEVSILTCYNLVKNRNPCLCKISISQHQHKTSVKELSYKDSDFNGPHLSRFGVFTDHCDEFNHDELQNRIDYVNRYTHHQIQRFGSIHVDQPISADWTVLAISISVDLSH